MDETTQTIHSVPMTPVYRHVNGQEWGLAILAWERGPRRGYQFEDGELRVFRDGYYHLLEPVQLPMDRRSIVIPKLRRMRGAAPQRTRPVASSRGDALGFEDQLRVFAIEYPEGFDDPAWKTTKRGLGVSRRLKRHRDAAIRQAQERLGREQLDRCIESAQYDAVRNATLSVLEETDLMTKRQRQPLIDLPISRLRPFAMALRSLLYGTEPFDLRFEQLIASVARSGESFSGWQLATAPAALVHPEEHVCIRPSVFRKQAASVEALISVPRSPSAKAYGSLLDLTKMVRDRLEAVGHDPADLFDIYDFIIDTQRPSARKLIEH